MAIVTSFPDSVRTRSDDWQHYVKTAIRDVNQLWRELKIESTPVVDNNAAQRQFGTFVPLPYLQRIEPNNARDPLLLQVLAAKSEMQSVPGYQPDAVGDLASQTAPGVIHKYLGRALLVASGSCAIHCRYCFRRHFPYQTQPVSITQWQDSLKIIAQDKSITEIILSGGDPLMIVDAKLEKLIELIEGIPHLRSLRIHTRLPVVIPQRVTDFLIDRLSQSRLTTVMVIHVNHPNEIDDPVREAVAKLRRAKLVMLNQSVLLRNVNDCSETLIELSRQLIEMNCLPYYLHQLDRVDGVAHFLVSEEHGRQLIEQMRQQLPGYAVPRYVTEIAGEPSKRIIA